MTVTLPHIPNNPDASDAAFRPNVDFVPTAEATQRYKNLGREATSLLVENMALTLEASRDDLTGLANEKAYKISLESAIERVEHSNLPEGEESDVALVEIDVDNFKAVNDTLGHPEGNTVLRLIADALNGSLRETDMPVRGDENEQASRPHGDEFRVLVRDINANTEKEMTKQERSEAIVGRIRDAVSRALQSSEHGAKLAELGVGVSIGSAFYRRGETIEAFQKRADEAMYTDKQSRRATS